MNLADLFKMGTLTASVNKLPQTSSKAGDLGIFAERGINTTFVVVEERHGRLFLIKNTSRNDTPPKTKNRKAKRRVFEVPHLPMPGELLPSDLQNFQPFGADQTVVNQQAVVINDKLAELRACVEITKEWHRVGAIQGKILDADGEVLWDLYDEFGVTAKRISVALGTDSTDVKKACLDAKRHAESKLTGVTATKFKAYCDAVWFDALTEHPKVVRAYANYQEAADRLGGDMRSGFRFGDIEFEEYTCTVTGSDGQSKAFFPAGKAFVFPVGRGVFQVSNAPANYNETVNTVGLPFYAKTKERDFNKGWDMEVQANPLTLNLFPEAIVELYIP